MLFFINSSFNEKNSGIEHAQLKRAQLFRKHQEPFKLVFREWNPHIHTFLKANGVSADETLVMFDYFQKTEKVRTKIIHVQDIDFGVAGLRYEKETEQSRYLVFRDNALIGRVRYYPDDKAERVSSVELFDGFGNLYSVEFYDFRGFLSLVQWYTPDNKVGTEVWYDINGRPVLETFNRYDAQGVYHKMGWRLTEDSGAVYVFATIDELTLHFFNRINAQYWDDHKANIFIMDRTHVGDWALQNLERPAYTVLHLHNSHAGDAQDTMHSIMNNFYEYGLTNANTYDAIISATKKQTKDVKARFEPKAKLFTIPVGVVPEAYLTEEHVAIKDRKHHSVLVTARVAHDKRIHNIIRSIGIARETIPDITLDYYGYVDHSQDNAAQKAIDEAIAEYNLKDAVTHHEYADAELVAKVQREHQVYGLASMMEGFNLAMMEAYSHGMVGLTYDVNYGPNELTVDGKNGYVVPFGDIEAMAAKLVELFSDDKKLQTMSNASYKLSERFSEESVWKAWEHLLNDAKKKKLTYPTRITKGLD